MEPEVEKILLLGIIQLLFTSPEVPIRKDLDQYVRERRCDCYHWFSDSLVSKNVFRARGKGREVKVILPPFPNSPEMPRAPGLHTALWCKTHVHVQTYQLQLRSSCDKSASRVRALPTNNSASKKNGLFCSGLIGFSLGLVCLFLMGKKKKKK